MHIQLNFVNMRSNGIMKVLILTVIFTIQKDIKNLENTHIIKLITIINCFNSLNAKTYVLLITLTLLGKTNFNEFAKVCEKVHKKQNKNVYTRF